ncbi:MAG: peptidoglycan editing factor PgeF [Halochromatium sp.]|nr:peptidoglycan editing factor PgeF [Halochromatium sp.]
MSLFFRPDWTAPAVVQALSTTRQGGVSSGVYASLNLASHVGDDPAAVQRNRALLYEQAQIPLEPTWLNQVHGPAVYEHGAARPSGRDADASVAFGPGAVCAVMTADCLPILLCDQAGTVVAAAHAGWRGLAAGVIEATVQRMRRPADQLQAWLGPAIGPAQFEVGDEVRARFCALDPDAAAAFRPNAAGRWLADLPMLARQRLARLGVTSVSGGDHCTLADRDRFFSYRRDGVTGRMASLIWLQSG